MKSFKSPYNLIVILGPTAGGKTSFAAHIAYHVNGEIISADSRQVYRNMDIGTGKDYDDYVVQGKNIPGHLIDIIDAGEEYNVFNFQKDFVIAFNSIHSRNKFPLLCGGTGLYIESLLKQYQLLKVPKHPQLREQLLKKSLDELTKLLRKYKTLHATTDTENKKRLVRAIEIEMYYEKHPEQKVDFPNLKPVVLGIKYDRNSRRKRITERLHERLDNEMVEEVKRLLDKGVSSDMLIRYGLEYKFITYYLLGHITYDEMTAKLNIAIHQFAKRQMTWFRRMERQGTKIFWFDGHEPMEKKIERALKLISG
jgi:tRNA dimethylallyltransferase